MSYIKILNQLTKLLNSLDKEYTIRQWSSGEGVDIVIAHYDDDTRLTELKKDYNIVISINNAEYVEFEYEPIEEVK